MKRRNLLLASAAATLALTREAQAQKFPSKPVTLVVPFAPGGNLDTVARTLAPALERALGQSVVVDNRAGAGGAIGAGYVARASADGHTLLVSTPNALVVLPRMVKAGYELASFSPIGLLATTPLVIVVNARSRFRDLAALLAEARAKPGQVSAGHAGPGTTNHIALLQLEQATKISINTIPYKGSAPALTDLIGGQLDLVIDQLTSSATHIKSGSLRVLAVLSAERDPALPEIPTMREASAVDFNASTAAGLLAPAGTPAATIDVLSAAVRKALDDEAVKSRLLSLGSPARPSTAAQWRDLLAREDASAQTLANAGRLKTD